MVKVPQGSVRGTRSQCSELQLHAECESQGFRVEWEEFARHALEVADDPASANLPQLYLAWACVRRDEKAIAELEEATSLEDSTRGAGGFGHTGR